MKLSYSQSPKPIVVLSLSFSLFFSTIVSPPVYAQSNLPVPTTHVSDTAGLVAQPTKQQLENTLANLQQRSGVNLTVLAVQTTGGQSIFDYSAAVARDWNIGLFAGAGKSLLLVLSVEEKTFSIRFTKGVQRDLPEGMLADVNELMRAPVEAGHVGEALLLGVQKMVSALAGRLSFSTEAMDQPLAAQASSEAPVAPDGNTREATANTQPAPVGEAKAAAATPAQSPDDSKTIDSRSQILDPKSQMSDSKSQISDSATREPATRKRESASEPTKTSGSKSAKNAPVDDEAEAEYVGVTLSKPLDERIDLLKAFITTHPDSKSKAHATELLIVARSARGDEKLKAGDTAAGVELLFLALADAPPDMPDKLFAGVISQIPVNLYVRGQASEALKAAQQVEAKVADNPKRLLALAGFYRQIERGDESVRLAQQAVKLAPDLAEARNALALALHISLRLDEAAEEYKHALELDPKTHGARRALADLDRAAGRFDEAVALYREQLAVASDDKPARAGLVISLFELGKIDEGKQELQAALKEDPSNLLLLTGAAYWLLAHGESTAALALAHKAANIEPRYTWAQIALSRSLVAQKQPLSAERSIRYARQYGRFPTLEYELASTLASMGLYDEASQALLGSFTWKDGQIETLLANRIPARAASFTELLALERRASIFQAAAADTEDNARTLKGLLAFTVAMNPQGADAKIDEAGAVAAAREFVGGSDDMRAYRQLYAASRLLQRGLAFQTVQELSDAARDGVDAAIIVPAATVAVQADELADIRARAIAADGTPDIPDAPRNVLANILRGRIEALSGWALFNLDKTAEAVEHLRRAAGILPVGTPLWQTACWHLGVALQQTGNDADALGYYIKSYVSGAADPARRSIIEQLYKKANGSLEGLDDRIGPATAAAAVTPSTGSTNANSTNDQPSPAKANPPLAEASPTPGPTPTPEPASAQSLPMPSATPEAGAIPALSPQALPQPTPSLASESAPTPSPTDANLPPPVNPEPTPAPQPTPSATSLPSPAATPQASPAPTPSPEPSQSPEPTPTPTPDATPSPMPSASPTLPEPSPTPTPVPQSTPTPAETTAPTPNATPASDGRPRRVKPPR